MRNKGIVPIVTTVFALISIALMLVSVKIALAVFAGGIVAVVVFFKPFQGLLLYLILTYLRPQEFIPALQEKPIMLALAFLLLGTLILHSTVRKKTLILINTRQGIFMFVFFLLIILSQLQTGYLTGTQAAFSDFLPIFLLFLMIINLTDNYDHLKKSIYLLFFMTMFLSLNGILQHIRGFDIAGQTMHEGRIRWIGIFSDPNDLGLTILAFTPVAVLNFLDKKKRLLKRSLWGFSSLILIYALYLTNSRGTFVGLLAILVFFLCKRIGLVKGLVIGVLISAAALAIGPSRMSEMSIDEASASGRIDAWGTGLNLLIWRPVLGIGYHNFTEYHHLTAHNSVVLCMSELGLAGLYVWLLLIVSSFREMILVQKYGRDTSFAHFGEVLQISISGFFVSAFFLSRAYNEVLYIILGLCTLLSLFSRQRFDYKFPLFSRSLLLSTLVFMIGLIVLIKILVLL